jgi:hypothetical protein
MDNIRIITNSPPTVSYHIQIEIAVPRATMVQTFLSRLHDSSGPGKHLNGANLLCHPIYRNIPIFSALVSREALTGDSRASTRLLVRKVCIDWNLFVAIDHVKTQTAAIDIVYRLIFYIRFVRTRFGSLVRL